MRTLLLLPALVAVVACGSSTPSGQGGGGSGATTDTGSTTSATDTGSTSSTTSAAPITACTEIQSTDCFTNSDCVDAADRCENRGTADSPVPCCVPGARGAGKAGDACASENDCEVAVCVDGICSKECSSDADCTPALPACWQIGVTSSVCLPS